MRRVFVFGVVVTLAASMALAEMQMSIEGDTLSGTGITPSARAVWFGVEWTQSDWYPNIEQVLEVRSDTSGKGDVELVRSDPVSSRSVWFLVDTATGEFVGETPAGEEYRETSTPEVTMSEDAEECTTLVVPSHEVVAVLLVRPTKPFVEELGVWQGEVGDGALLDRDGLTNGVIQVCLSDLVPVEGAGPTPSHVAAGDTVVVFDRETLACRATRVESGF